MTQKDTKQNSIETGWMKGTAIAAKLEIRPHDLIKIIKENLSNGLEVRDNRTDRIIIDIESCPTKTAYERRQVYSSIRPVGLSGRESFYDSSNTRYETIEYQYKEKPAGFITVNFNRIPINFLDTITIREVDIKNIIDNQGKDADNFVPTLRYKSALKIIASIVCENGNKEHLSDDNLPISIKIKAEKLGITVGEDSISTRINEIDSLIFKGLDNNLGQIPIDSKNDALAIIASIICENGNRQCLYSRSLVSNIKKKTEKIGYPLDEGTIRGFIKEIRAFLPLQA